MTRELLKQNRTAQSEFLIFTLETLARRVFALVSADRRLVEEPVQSLLLNQAIDQLWGSMGYFGSDKTRQRLPRGTFDKIAAVIKNLKETGVTTDVLRSELEGEEEDEKAKLRDIIGIYSAYESVLAKLEGVDVEGLFTELSANCPQSKFDATFRQTFPEVKTISIVGFDEFTQPELGFIQKLCNAKRHVSLTFDFMLGNRELFGHLEENYQRLRELGFVTAAEPATSEDSAGGQIDLFGLEPEPPRTELLQNYFARNLFRQQSSVEQKDCSDVVTIAKAKDRLCEVELICKLIKQLVADDPSRDLSRICVATYRPQIYSGLFREQARKFGIPMNVTDRFELSQAPVVVAIIGLLEIAARGFRRDDVLRVIASRYFDFNDDGVPIDGENLMTISVDLKILRGVKNWLKKIDELIAKAQIEQRLSSDEQESVRRARDIRRLEKAASDIRWLDALLHGVSADQTASSFERTVSKLLDTLKLPRQILALDRNTHGELIERDARAYARFLEVLTTTKCFLEYQQGKGTTYGATYSLRFFLDQLKIAISQERYNVREVFGQGVLVTSIEETRGLPIDVMIVTGLVDGEFPSVYQSEIFLSNSRLKAREQRHTWENKYLFYQAVTNWTEHLYLTYPQQDADLDLVQSSFIDAVETIAGTTRWSYPGDSPFEQTLYSKEDFLRAYGRAVGAESERTFEVPDSVAAETDYIRRAIEVEQSRVDLHTLPEYEGIILHALPPEMQQKLLQLKDRVYSVSQLETYGKCPYQFLAHRLLRLNVVEEFDEEFSPLEKGSVLHEALFEFYTERREKNLPSLIGCADAVFAEANRRLLEITERRLAAIDIPDAFWDLEKELILGDRDSGRGVLWEFLNHERNRSTTLQPAYFEVGFGSKLGAQTRIDREFSSEDPIVAGNVQLRGKVDRVDMNDEAFSIIDYKTGKAIAKLEDVRTGISLQLPVYLYSIERLMQEKLGVDRAAAGGSHYQLRPPIALKIGVGSASYKDDIGATGKGGFLESDQELRALIDESIAMINKFVEGMSQGRFPLAEPKNLDKVCKWCDYKTICRIQTIHQIGKAKADP
ncbi:MAG: exodeoxyribonuclease V subunit gamma [Ignavibacteriae bacterium]|nr:exodeoxyribonuclease V subunit gamma [Ignavibacteriota bacterium]